MIRFKKSEKIVFMVKITLFFLAANFLCNNSMNLHYLTKARESGGLSNALNAAIWSEYMGDTLYSMDSGYSKLADEIVGIVNATCHFSETEHIAEDVICVANATDYLFTNGAYIYDYNHDGNKTCTDTSLSFIYVLGKFGIEAYTALTKGHMLTLVKVSDGVYLINDPSFRGFHYAKLDEYFYVSLK